MKKREEEEYCQVQEEPVNEIADNKNIGFDNNKYVLEMVNMWIQNADNKISISFGLLSLLLAAITFVVDSLLSDLTIPSNANGILKIIFYALVVIAGVAFIVAVVAYAYSVIPRLDSGSKDKDLDKYSLFYGDIQKAKSAERYLKITNETERKTIEDEMIKEIYYNSKICAKKMRGLRVGIIASAGAIILTILSAFFYSLYTIC